jgi:hypothetical protein
MDDPLGFKDGRTVATRPTGRPQRGCER